MSAPRWGKELFADVASIGACVGGWVRRLGDQIVGRPTIFGYSL
jgi:hypothetical protein